MKVFYIIIPFFIVMFSMSYCAKSCNYFPTQKGSYWIRATYNAKTDRIIHYEIEEITSVKDKGQTLQLTVSSTYYNPKTKTTITRTYFVKCSKGNLAINMRAFVSFEYLGNDESELEISSVDMLVSSSLSSGQKLEDANITIKYPANKMPASNTPVYSVTHNNRRVRKTETTTTPAGTFECVVIDSDVNITTLKNMPSKTAFWFAPDKGIVRTENYDQSGRIQTYSVLRYFTVK